MRDLRRGFTLVEILVVLAIISVLVALTTVALQKTIGGNKLKVTETTIFKLQKTATDERHAVVAACEKDHQSRNIPAAVLAFCDGDATRARAVWAAAKLRQHFPLTFADANTAISFANPANPADVFVLRPLTAFGEVIGAVPPVIDSEGINELHESGAILFIVLSKKANSGGAFAAAADDLTSVERTTIAFGPKELTTFKDGWGRPIGFRFHHTQNPAIRPLLAGWNLPATDPRMTVIRALEPYEMSRIVSVQSKGEVPTYAGVTDDVLGELLYYGGGNQKTNPKTP